MIFRNARIFSARDIVITIEETPSMSSNQLTI
jgi:hypothetical protein